MIWTLEMSVGVDEMPALIDAHGTDHAMAGGRRCVTDQRSR